MTGSPFGWGTSTVTISSSKRPASAAASARRCDSSAKASWSSRETLVPLGHVLGRLAHRLGRVALGNAGVDEAPADGGVDELRVAAREAALGLQHHERRAGHRLHAAGEDEVRLAEPDLARGLARSPRGPRRRAGSRSRRAPPPAARRSGRPCARCCGCPRRPGWCSPCRPRRSTAGSSSLRSTAASIVAGGEVVGPHAGEHAGVAAHGRAKGVDDHGVWHGAGAYTRLAWTSSPCSSSSEGWW